MAEWPPICPHCGKPVEIPDDYLDQFETADDAQAAGPVLHVECAKEYAGRSGRPTSRVVMYDERDVGPISAA